MGEPEPEKSPEQRLLDAVDAVEDLRTAYQRQNHYRMLVVALALVVGAGSLLLGFRRGDSFCESQNAFKRADRARWEYILNISAEQERTPEQQRQRDAFVVFINEADKTVPCGWKL